MSMDYQLRKEMKSISSRLSQFSKVQPHYRCIGGIPAAFVLFCFLVLRTQNHCYAYQFSRGSQSRRHLLLSSFTGLSSAFCWIQRSFGSQDLSDLIQPATVDQPQIPLPTKLELGDNSKSIIAEGLIYLKNPKSERRPSPTDSLVLTVSLLNDPTETPIAGARLPMSRIRLPLRFQLTRQNALLPQSEAAKLLSDQDLMVQAIVCPDDTAANLSGMNVVQACRELNRMRSNESDSNLVQAKGVAKLIRLPDLPSVRAAVPLPLE